MRGAPTRVVRLANGETEISTGGTVAIIAKETITTDDVRSHQRLAELLERLARAVEALGRVAPRPTIEFEDVSVTSGTDVRLEHGFGCRVRWYLVAWRGASGAAPILSEDQTASTENLLVLDCGQSGTGTIRVEAV